MIPHWCWLLAGLTVFGLGSVGHASDVLPDERLSSAEQATSICPKTCRQFDCAWSGEWRPAETAAGDSDLGACDCGIPRIRNIPGGNIQNAEDAKVACHEICDLNDDKWNGQWQAVPGGFDVCGCTYVSEYCPTE